MLRVCLSLLASLSSLEAATLSRSSTKVIMLRGGAGPAAPMMTTVKTAPEAYHGFAAKGVENAGKPPLTTLLQSILGGCYVGIGGLVALSVAGNIGKMTDGNPGLQKFVFAALFPMNLLLILMTGGQLFTGNSAAVSAAFFEGQVTLGQLARSWGISYIGNVIGCGLLALATEYCHLNTYGVKEMAVATAVKKCSSAFGPTLVKAILCNWLVNMAIWIAGAANDLTGKMVGIWFPISTFVAIGLEHSVANMYLLPLGVMGGADLSVADLILKNLIPVTLGNALAGVFILGAAYSYCFGALGSKE